MIHISSYKIQKKKKKKSNPIVVGNQSRQETTADKMRHHSKSNRTKKTQFSYQNLFRTIHIIYKSSKFMGWTSWMLWMKAFVLDSTFVLRSLWWPSINLAAVFILNSFSISYTFKRKLQLEMVYNSNKQICHNVMYHFCFI